MKVILTKKVAISAKGKDWVKVGYINRKDGSTGTIFTSKEDFDGYNIPESAFLSDEDFTRFVGFAPVVEVDFDERGRVINVEA